MPSLVGTTVATNYQRVVGPSYTESAGARTYAGPFSSFGTRVLAFYLVDIANLETTPYASDSVFAKVLRGVAQVAELYYVGTPTADGVIIAIAADTDGSTTASNGQTLAEAIDAATAGTSTVTAKAITGNAFV